MSAFRLGRGGYHEADLTQPSRYPVAEQDGVLYPTKWNSPNCIGYLVYKGGGRFLVRFKCDE